MKDNKPSSYRLSPPQVLIDDIVDLELSFIDFQGTEKSGTIQVNQYIADDVVDVFKLMIEIGFPIHMMQPVSEFDFSDDKSMIANNSSGFNFRTVALDPSRISNHSYGLAIDINPVHNPYIKGEVTLPPTANYDIDTPGTLHADHPVVVFMKEQGFVWGGDWDKPYRDYQHFHKELPAELEEKYREEIQNVLSELK